MTRCQGLGNVSRYCNRPVTCIRCWEEGHHVIRRGKMDDTIQCVNCRRAGFKDVKHSVQGRDCQCAVIHRSRMIDRTKYE